MAERLIGRAIQLLAAAVIVIVTAPLWLAAAVVGGVLALARPFIVVVLGGGLIGGLGAGAFFAYSGAWTDAAEAGFLVVVAGGVLMAYLAFIEPFDSPDLRDRLPPWWWNI